MRPQSASWFQGWKILLRCAEFRCQDGSLKFASTAILKHLPPASDCTSLQWPDRMMRSIVFPDDAFVSRDAANADALSKARLQILALNGSTDRSGRKVMKSRPDMVRDQESDESLAAQFEISFDGKRYAFRQHRYEVFQDALRYAVAEHAKPGFVHDDMFKPSWAAAYRPTDEDERTMKRYGIDYAEGHFRYGGFRYGQLCDAVAFASEHPNL